MQQQWMDDPQASAGPMFKRATSGATTAPELDPAMREAAEEIRAHLVSLRGGALFLSPVDGRLLLTWLESGVSVSFVLKTLEEVSASRRAKKVKTPIKLSTIKSKITKAIDAPPEAPLGDLAPLVMVLRASEHPLERVAAGQLAALTGEGEELLRAAMVISREFFEVAWDQTDREALRAEADLSLAVLKETMSERKYDAILEETARDLLRQRHPLLSASQLWDTLAP